MNKNRKQIEDKKPKKAPLVYINRVEMKELDENNEYEFLPDIIDKDGNIVKLYRGMISKQALEGYIERIKGEE